MKQWLPISALLIALGCTSPAAQNPPTKDSQPPTPASKEPEKAADAPASEQARIQPHTVAEQEAILAQRTNGAMDYTFAQFANMYLVSSRLQFGDGIALVTSSREVSTAPLQSPFPSSYRPTLREFFDAIALQTSSAWQYDSSGKYFHSEVPHAKPVKDLAFFEFQPAKREKPYEVKLAEGWKAEDKGNWVMFVPPSFPVGMDIYEMGEYSSDKADDKFFEQIRHDIAWEWVQRVSEKGTQEDLKPAQVGKYPALYFESMIPSQIAKEIRWRHWVFMVEEKAYFIVSTILPEKEEEIFPDVEAMIASFEIK